MKNALILFAILGMLLFAGCAQLEGITNNGGSSGSGSTGGYANGGVTSGIAIAPGAPAGGKMEFAPSPAPNAFASDQQLIKTANAEVEVPSGTLQAKTDSFRNAILGEGGQVVSADYSETESTKQYNLQIKIPPSKFDSLAAQLQGIGSVKSMNSNVNDVSDQYVDINTRIKNLQMQRDELSKLYNRSGKLEDLLTVEQEITRVQTEIEMYQNQKLNMDRQVAMSSVWVRIYEQAPVVDRTVLLPLGDVFNVFLGALGAAILVISGLLGFAIPVLIVLGIAYLAYRRFFAKKAAKK